MIYFDHAATTKINDEVLALYFESLKQDFANPSSAHKLGKDLNKKIFEIRQYFLKNLNAKSDDLLIFTATASEANNTVIKGIELLDNDTVLYFKGDHKSVVESVENGLSNTINKVSVNFYKDFEIKDDLQVKLIILSHVNSQSGQVLNFNKIAQEFKMKFPKAHIHLDAVQGVGKIDFSLSQYIDSATFTAHKIQGPKGIAALYLNKKHKIRPLINGGGQQFDLRAGTESYPLIKAFKLAFELAVKQSTVGQAIKINNLIKDGLLKIVPEIIFPFESTSPYILCFIIPKISSDILIRHLETREVFLSSTSACSSKIKGFNSTLMALGIEEKYHKNVIRISLGPHSTEEEGHHFLKIFNELWQDIKHLVR